MNNEDDQNKTADALDYRTQNLGASTFETDPSLQSVSFKTKASQSANYKIGDIVGNSYRLLKQIGRGGMGVVYLSEHVIIGQHYALKLLAPNQITATNWARFEIEGRALARLDHPNIVKIFNMGIDQQGCPFYVMDLLPGQSLLDQMEAGPLSQSDILAIYAQVCAGLGSAHKTNIVHRDVKPSNIMLTGEIGQKGSVKVVDFGIASMGDNRSSQSLTTIGEVFGSPLYMSPEQCAGEKVDQRSDIYSLGCSLFHSLTGRPPFTGSSALETLTMHVKQAAPRLADVNKQIAYSESLEQLLERLLLKNPVRRYQTMEQVLHDIDRIAQDKPIYKSHTMSDGELKPLLSAVAPVTADFRHSSQPTASKGDYQSEEAEQESDLETSPDLHLLKLAVIIVFSLGVLAAAVIGFNAWNKGNKSSNLNADTQQTEPGKENTAAAGPDKRSNFGEVLIGGEITHAHNLIFIKPLTDYEHRKTREITKNGRHYRRIAFPDTFSVGEIYFVNKKYTPIAAENYVNVPAGEQLILNLNDSVALYPAFLDKLATEDIVEVQLKRIPNGAAATVLHMAGWKSLHHLWLNNCSFEKNQLAVLDALPHLGALTFTEDTLEPKELADLKVIDRLFALLVSGQSLPNNIYERLANSKQLSYLELSEIDWPDTALTSIARSRTLTGLTLHSDKLKDEDIKTISSMPQLKALDIQGRDLTDKCVDYLVTCKNLKTLQVSSLKSWSAESIQRLRRVVPRFVFSSKQKRKVEPPDLNEKDD